MSDPDTYLVRYFFWALEVFAGTSLDSDVVYLRALQAVKDDNGDERHQDRLNEFLIGCLRESPRLRILFDAVMSEFKVRAKKDDYISTYYATQKVLQSRGVFPSH